MNEWFLMTVLNGLNWELIDLSLALLDTKGTFEIKS